MKILITGTAGFIGYHLASTLSNDAYRIVGIDNINDYYDVNLKYSRLTKLGFNPKKLEYSKFQISNISDNHKFTKLNLEDREKLNSLFEKEKFDVVCNLAAQTGVRYSLKNPYAYIDSNILGFLNILECCKKYKVKHLVYASSSSVYGLNTEMPFSVHHNVDHPVSLYAAGKKSNELMAHVYSHLFDLPTSGLRFFTVYGPLGRPDMALFIFTKAILDGKPIQIFNNGNMNRDFTYIDDIITGVVNVIKNPPNGDKKLDGNDLNPSNSSAPFRIYNIGNSKSVKLMDFITAIEEILEIEAKKEFLPMQPGDVASTWADVTELEMDFGYRPNTPVKLGVKKFIEWYLTYYKHNELYRKLFG